MNKPPSKTQFIDSLRQGRLAWDALLSQLDESQLTQPGVCAEWSVKDIIAHITWFEGEMVGLLQARAMVGSDLWNLPTDQRNAAIYAQNMSRLLEDVLSETGQVHAELLEALEALPEEYLTDPALFPGMPPDWQPWEIIAGNSYDHYPHHIPDVGALLGLKP